MKPHTPSSVATPRRAAARRRGSRILVGTASWTDPGFIADWYPKGLPPRERLPWYAEHFNLVEVNSSFYAIPSPTQVARWSDETPEEFVFDVKLHRLLSRHSTPVKFLPRHLRKLAGPEPKKAQISPKLETALVETLLEALEPLAEAGKLGALLLQLSPSFGPRNHSLDELDHLFELLESHRVAVELRNSGWFEETRLPGTISFFRKRHLTLVAVDAPQIEHFMVMPEMDVVTNRKLAYLRAHGRDARGYISGRTVAQRFDYDYFDAELREIAQRAIDLSHAASDTHIIFNNNKGSYAPEAAERFRRIVAKKSTTAAPAKYEGLIF